MNGKDILGVALLIFITVIALILSGVLLGANKPKQVDTTIAVTPAPPPPFFGVIPTTPPDTYTWNLTAQPAKIDWGTLYPGFTYSRQLIITNSGNLTSQPLNMTSDSTVGAVTWDAEGKTLPPSSHININFSLAVSLSAPQGQFNFTIIITG